MQRSVALVEGMVRGLIPLMPVSVAGMILPEQVHKAMSVSHPSIVSTR
jgi:hypothetical protein